MKRFVEKKAGVFEPVNPNCTCFDRASSKCVPQQICTSCNAFPDSPNCNYRVGNRLVSRYQTPVGGNIYATPTNRFRNAATLMLMGTDNGGFSMPMGISERANFQNANGSAEEIGGKQENPTRGLYGITIITLKRMDDKTLYILLKDAMRSVGLIVPMNFSPKLVEVGVYQNGRYAYAFQIRNGLTAKNFVIENREKRGLEYSFINNLGQKVGRPYTAVFTSGYLHSPKGGGGLPIGGGRFGNASGVIPPFPIVPTCPIGYAQKTYKYIGGKTRTICVPLPKKFVYSD